MTESGGKQTMEAWMFAEHGEPRRVLVLRQVPVPVPGPGQALVQVEAAAVNFADSLLVGGTYQTRPALPAVAGMELAGRVTAVGSGASIALGARVAGLGHQLCGAFAEYALMDEVDARLPPDDYSAIEAAGFTVAYQTAWFALHVRGGLRAGESVLVHAAAGGVGLAAIHLAAAAGARVIGIVGRPEKVEAARDAGCHDVFVRGQADLVERIKDAALGGVDLVVDPVGGASHQVSERVVRFEARIVLLGFASGELPVMRPDLLMVKNYSVVGLHWGLYRERRPDLLAREYLRLCETVAAAGVRPLVSEVADFADVVGSLAKVASGQSVGRVVMRSPTEPSPE